MDWRSKMTMYKREELGQKVVRKKKSVQHFTSQSRVKSLCPLDPHQHLSSVVAFKQFAELLVFD